MRTRHQRQAFGRALQKVGATKIIRAADSPGLVINPLGNALLREPQTAKIYPLPLKPIRLQQLVEAGFNCPDYKFWLLGKLNIEELRAFWQKYGSVSSRNFREENALEQTPKLPVDYAISDCTTLEKICAGNNLVYHTLVNEALPLRDSLAAGNIILFSSSHIVSYFEGYSEGQATPRDVDEAEKLKVYLRKYDAPPPEWAPEQLEDIVTKLRTFQPEFRPMVLEFSIYPYPVGMRQEQVIFWEWRSGSAHDLVTVVSRLLERIDSYEVALAIPHSNAIPHSK